MKSFAKSDNKNFYYAPTRRHIELAAEFKIPNVIIDSRGHAKDIIAGMNDDQLCVLKEYKKVYKTRSQHVDKIKKEVQVVRKRIQFARSLGLNPFIHSYELSLPLEFRKAYPELFVKRVKELIKEDPTCAEDRQLCLSFPEVREVISAKFAEIIGYFPDLTGYVYSFHESQLTAHNHYCDKCKNLERATLIKWLYEAVCEGVSRVRSDVLVITRLWGITHPEGLQYENQVKLAEITDHTPLNFRNRRLKTQKKYHPRPSKVNPKIETIVKEGSNTVMYKATWGDYTLKQPLNHWANSYGNTTQIIELSMEHLKFGKYLPLIISKQHLEMIRKLKRKNHGFCIVPISVGRPYNKTYGYQTGAHPDKWEINRLNLYLLPEMIKNPGLDLEKTAKKILEKLYQTKVPKTLVSSLFTATDILEKIVNINGVSTVMNLESLLRPRNYSFEHVIWNTFWYMCMRKDGKKRISPDDKNLHKIFQEKDAGLKDAEELLTGVSSELGKMHESRLKNELSNFFARYIDLCKVMSVSRKRLWLEYKFAREKKVSYSYLKEMDRLIKEEKALTKSDFIRKIFTGEWEKLDRKKKDS